MSTSLTFSALIDDVILRENYEVSMKIFIDDPKKTSPQPWKLIQSPFNPNQLEQQGPGKIKIVVNRGEGFL